MVANRKTRSKPVAGSARTAGHALQKSTTASALDDKSEAVAEGMGVEPVESDLESSAEPVASEPAVSELVVSELVVSELVVLDVELLELDVSDSVFLNAVVLDLDVAQASPPSAPDTPKATSAKTIPTKATQKTKGASAMTQSETPKTNAVAKAADSSSPKPALQVAAVTMFYSAGERPIGASSMQVFGTILNGRPIEASSVKIFDILPGDRPVFANEVSYMTVGLPQNRPVLVSPPGMMHAQTLMGGRPIFSNEDVTDPTGEALMGYLD